MSMRCVFNSLALALALFFSHLSGVSEAATYSGDNISGQGADGSWARPIGGGPGISSFGPVNFSTQDFFVQTTGTYSITSIQDYDGYIHLYEGSFDPLNQNQNLIDGDDDGSGGIGTSDLLGLSLAIDTQYILVTSAFSASDQGNFTNEIMGAGAVALGALTTIPLPPAMVLLLGGLAGFAGLSRARDRKS